MAVPPPFLLVKMLTLMELQAALEPRFLGSFELANKKIRTRSKLAKTMACEALGYAIPKSFVKSSPRFPAENFDISVQKANNFQLWNAELDPTRRYVFVILSEAEQVIALRVLIGEDLAKYNSTGVSTLKHQAGFEAFASAGFLVVGDDTEIVQAWLAAPPTAMRAKNPSAPPDAAMQSLANLGTMLQPLLGTTLRDPGAVQERLRGQELHVIVSARLGYGAHSDSGQHPDIPHQLLELKLQTSPTIDLGLVDPVSVAPLGPPFADHIRHADTRYAIFGGVSDGNGHVRLTSLVMVSGEQFFTAFRRFGGLGVNGKLQFHLPKHWWG